MRQGELPPFPGPQRRAPTMKFHRQAHSRGIDMLSPAEPSRTSHVMPSGCHRPLHSVKKTLLYSNGQMWLVSKQGTGLSWRCAAVKQQLHKPCGIEMVYPRTPASRSSSQKTSYRHFESWSGVHRSFRPSTSSASTTRCRGGDTDRLPSTNGRPATPYQLTCTLLAQHPDLLEGKATPYRCG